VDDNQGVPALPDKIYPCPECSKPMRRINGRKGPFWSCSGYPACRHAVNDLNGAPEGIVAAQVKNQQKTA
ncbi:topoisomerase DNA-binding C4 zinc finger domain-containing protein, partial [Thiolapillus sp.]